MCPLQSRIIYWYWLRSAGSIKIFSQFYTLQTLYQFVNEILSQSLMVCVLVNKIWIYFMKDYHTIDYCKLNQSEKFFFSTTSKSCSWKDTMTEMFHKGRLHSHVCFFPRWIQVCWQRCHFSFSISFSQCRWIRHKHASILSF